MVLTTLDAMGPMHGFGIARRIEQISEDAMQVNQGRHDMSERMVYVGHDQDDRVPAGGAEASLEKGRGGARVQ